MQKPTFPSWPELDRDDYEAVKGVLDSRALWCGAPASPYGKQVWRFQEEFSRFQGVRRSIAVTNGTHALEAALRALGVGLGDEVIVTDYTFVASASAVVAVNAVPIFCDIHPRTLNMDPLRIEPLITPRTRAIIAVHLGGMPCDMEAILALAGKHGLSVLEDCAHAHGSKFRGRRVGNFGRSGAFSFQASKLLAAGEGGAIVTNDEALAEEIYSICDAGRKTGDYFYAHHRHGSNFRMGEFQAAVLRTQLRKLEAWQHALRNRNATYLRERLDAIDGVRCQERIQGVEEVGQYVFPVLFEPEKLGGISKEELSRRLNARGIPTTACYPPLHSLACFREVRGMKGIDYSRANWGGARSDDRNFPVTSEVYRRSFELPQEVFLVKEEGPLDLIAETVEEIRKS